MDIRSYSLVTAAYWGFTLTDGALRMLVLLHFHALGYTPLHLAFLFVLYECCGMATNLLGGWIGSRMGVRVTLFAGLVLQVVALLMLSGVQASWLTWVSVAYVMGAQALSGIAKDLTKMSSKSAVKLVVAGSPTSERQATLFQWVAVLTGSKNALKGCGFLLGGVLLSWLGFALALWAMAAGLALILLLSVASLNQDMGKSKEKVKFSQLFSKSRAINVLSLARLFLFGSRDVWFVVGLPIFLADTLGWSLSGVGAFLAAWVVGYGGVQAVTPQFLDKDGGAVAGTRAAQVWGFGLAGLSVGLALVLQAGWYPALSVIVGLAVFGLVFAVNSAVHSYLILAYSDADQVTLDVGFYYMANAAGRLVGTLLSGGVYLLAGLPGCLWTSAGLVFAAAGLTLVLPAERVLEAEELA